MSTLSLRRALATAAWGCLLAACSGGVGPVADVQPVNTIGEPFAMLAVYGVGLACVLVGSAVAIAAMHWLAAKQLLLRAKTPRSERILIGRVVSARVAWSAAERTQPPTGPHRRGVVEPFDLDVRGESEPVRVAGGPVRVVGQIDAVDWLVAGDAEHPRAVLRPGAHVTADVVTDGSVERAAPGDTRLRLRPYSELMVETVDPVRALSRKLRALTAAGALLGLLVVHGLSLGYHLRVFAGRTVVAHFASMYSERVDGDAPGDQAHFNLYFTVTLPDGARLRREVDVDTTPDVSLRGDPLYARDVPGMRWASDLGRTPTIHGALVLLHLGLGGAFMVLAAMTLVAPRLGSSGY